MESHSRFSKFRDIDKIVQVTSEFSLLSVRKLIYYRRKSHDYLKNFQSGMKKAESLSNFSFLITVSVHPSLLGIGIPSIQNLYTNISVLKYSTSTSID